MLMSAPRSTSLRRRRKRTSIGRTSIVDLMKLLDLDSGLRRRKELAKRTRLYRRQTNSARMNIWLHRRVMAKLAANGGKVPADLKD